MSKIKLRSFPQNTANYTKTAAPKSSVAQTLHCSENSELKVRPYFHNFLNTLPSRTPAPESSAAVLVFAI